MKERNITTSVKKDCHTRRVTSMKSTFCLSSDDPFKMHYSPPPPLNQRNRQNASRIADHDTCHCKHATVIAASILLNKSLTVQE
jgi:hypothetical protein